MFVNVDDAEENIHSSAKSQFANFSVLSLLARKTPDKEKEKQSQGGNMSIEEDCVLQNNQADHDRTIMTKVRNEGRNPLPLYLYLCVFRSLKLRHTSQIDHFSLSYSPLFVVFTQGAAHGQEASLLPLMLPDPISFLLDILAKEKDLHSLSFSPFLSGDFLVILPS